MASVSNLDQDLAYSRKHRYSTSQADKVKKWLYEILDIQTQEEEDNDDVIDILKDGTILCKLANKITPNSCTIIKVSNSPFVQMENISKFLKFASNYGVSQPDLFLTVDLYEEKDPAQVIQTLYSLSRIANSKTNGQIPAIDKSSSSSPHRQQQQYGIPVDKSKPPPAWNTHQYGYMGGASQGKDNIVFGRKRDITGP